jgi:hypothetical protein
LRGPQSGQREIDVRNHSKEGCCDGEVARGESVKDGVGRARESWCQDSLFCCSLSHDITVEPFRLQANLSSRAQQIQRSMPLSALKTVAKGQVGYSQFHRYTTCILTTLCRMASAHTSSNANASTFTTAIGPGPHEA